jgi:hypothetical protein
MPKVHNDLSAWHIPMHGWNQPPNAANHMYAAVNAAAAYDDDDKHTT